MKSLALIMFSTFILMMSWEGQKTDASAINTLIPQDSIRLRILANSDRPADQLVKRKVRDAVVEQMNTWVESLEQPQSLEAAREIVRAKLPEVEAQVARTLKENGKSYGFKVELGQVPFPAKLYGGTLYPAGNYEALRVTLGDGEGKNWWCVLFPPLCFIDAGSGEALAQSSNTEGTEGKRVQASEENTEVRFFLWELLENVWDWFVGLFA
ncbi:stage II sporulation protein R [Paenibacillus sp. CAA11]|nr:stage II sporulation protein R [Paenibacillus sp. CAA11]